MSFRFRVVCSISFFLLASASGSPLISVANATPVQTSVAPWLEQVRTYALRMITEAQESSSASSSTDLSRDLPQLRDQIQNVFLHETSQIYAYQLNWNKQIYMNPVLAQGPIELAASVLLHEGGHLLGDDECRAETRSAYVSQHSFLSHGLLMFGYLRQCENLRTLICGEPVFIQWPESPFHFETASRRELKNHLSDLTDFKKDKNIPFFFANRAAGWVGGDSICKSQITGNFNETLKVSYPEFFEKQMRSRVVQYFTDVRQDQVARIHAILGW